MNFQGDILRVEKEHQVLQEQLREAEEKFEQSQSRSLEEVAALEELLKKSIEETEVKLFPLLRGCGIPGISEVSQELGAAT